MAPAWRCRETLQLYGSVSRCSVTAWVPLPAGETVDLGGVGNVGTATERLTTVGNPSVSPLPGPARLFEAQTRTAAD